MREIKFRAWDPNSDHMLPPVGIDKVHLYDYQGDNITEQEGLVLMQFTGLHDKNGKEIYEGDVFPPTERTRGEVTIVCYDSNQGSYKAVPLSLYKANAGNGGWTGYGINQFGEVIGNIYEHPHLLEE